MYGIVHIPDAIPAAFSQKMGVVILHAGRQARRGPHKLYVKVARALCREGFYVFRYDNRGYGDSEGSESMTMDDWFDDALHAIKFFFKSQSLDKLILWGLCGGSVLAVHCAASEPSKIDSLILCNLIYRPDIADPRGEFKTGYRKLLTLGFWRKILSASPIYYIKKGIPNVKRLFTRAFFPSQFEMSFNDSVMRLVQSLPDSFSKASKPASFIFSTADPFVGNIKEDFLGNPVWRKHFKGIPIDLCLIEGADHNFSSIDYERAAIDKTIAIAVNRALSDVRSEKSNAI